MADHYYIVLDMYPRKYDLMFGDPESATGVFINSARSIKSLLDQVDKGESVYRTYLPRTDGRDGTKIIRLGKD